MAIGRRGLFGGLAVMLAAPAIIRTPGLLMPISVVPESVSATLYSNRTIRVYMDVQQIRDRNVLMQIHDYAGTWKEPELIGHWKGVPIRAGAMGRAQLANP